MKRHFALSVITAVALAGLTATVVVRVIADSLTLSAHQEATQN
jgi:hypothetical protein